MSIVCVGIDLAKIVFALQSGDGSGKAALVTQLPAGLAGDRTGRHAPLDGAMQVQRASLSAQR